MREENREEFAQLLRDEFEFRKPKGKVCDNKLLTDYWQALKDLPIELVRSGFTRHRKAGRGFPVPADIRPRDERGNAKAPIGGEQQSSTDNVRGHWRSIIVSEVCDVLDLRFRHEGLDVLDELLRTNGNFADALRHLLDELCDQEARDGRTDGMMRGCRRRCADAASYFQHAARAEVKRRAEINKPQRTAALPLSAAYEGSAQEFEP